MAKYNGPKCRLCRREGTKLFLKGARCSSEKCAITKRNQPPGQHGLGRRKRFSDYSRHLREKQKVKRIYGILESQFRNYYEAADKKVGITGELLLQSLECRLDNVVYRSGFAESRGHARQKVRQGKIKVDGKVVDIPSYQVSSKKMITSEGASSTPKEDKDLPRWLVWNKEKSAIVVNDIPARSDIADVINEQLIVEFYSR